MLNARRTTLAMMIAATAVSGCDHNNAAPAATPSSNAKSRFLNEPLISHLHAADPSAHVFAGRIYLYVSHDIETHTQPDADGSHFAMNDYRVLSLARIGGEVNDHGVALDLAQINWAKRQLWAPDATEKDGKYFLYFPAKDRQEVFRIGVAVSDKPEGPFSAQREPLAGTFSIDPAIFKNDDGSYYLYWGGIRGGQLQRWSSGEYRAADAYPPDDAPALSPKVARLSGDLLALAETPRDILILDETGRALTAGDADRRFFEGSWIHKYRGKYYFSYSTGDTHFIVYAIGDSPYGPFTYAGRVLEPVLGWTSQHSIVEFQGKWYLFYHDSQVSNGQTHLRNVKVTELHYNADGMIQTLDPFAD